MMNQIELARIEALSHHIALTDVERSALLDSLAITDPKHGLRAAFIDSLHGYLRDAEPHVIGRFEDFRALFPKLAPFSYMPVADLTLLMIAAGKLVFPERSPRAGISAYFVAQNQRLASIPAFQTALRAADNDVKTYLRLVLDWNNLFQNFAVYDYEFPSDREFVVHVAESYSEATIYYSEGFYLGGLALFGLEGEVEFDVVTPYSYTTVVRW